MPTVTTFPLAWTTICVDSTTAVAFPASAWMSAQEWAKFRGTMELRGITGLTNVTLGYQTCNVENAPDTAVPVPGYQTANGVYFPSAFTDISSDTFAKQLVRLVWRAKRTSGSTLGTARVGGSVDIVSP